MEIKNDMVLNRLPDAIKKKSENLIWARKVDFRKTVKYCREKEINHVVVGVKPRTVNKPVNQVIYIGKLEIDKLPKRLIKK